MVSLDRCDVSCNTFNNLSDRVCFPRKTKDANVNIINKITEINQNHQLNIFRLITNVNLIATQTKNGIKFEESDDSDIKNL